MKKLNLVEILKNAPVGTKLWSPIFGEVTFKEIREELNYPIIISTHKGNVSFRSDGLHLFGYPNAECTLWPSKENRNWDNFVIEDTFEDQEIVWVRNGGLWVSRYYSIKKDDGHYCYNDQEKEGRSSYWAQCVKFNKRPF